MENEIVLPPLLEVPGRKDGEQSEEGPGYPKKPTVDIEKVEVRIGKCCASFVHGAGTVKV